MHFGFTGNHFSQTLIYYQTAFLVVFSVESLNVTGASFWTVCQAILLSQKMAIIIANDPQCLRALYLLTLARVILLH